MFWNLSFRSVTQRKIALFTTPEAEMKQYDLVIQLGSQVKYLPDDPNAIDGYVLAPHTAMRTEASALAIKKGITQRLMIAGGSNFGVRYHDTELLKPPVFTFEAFADADFNRKSEAVVIKDFLVKKYSVQSNKVSAETLSSTTKENAAFVVIILQRRPMFTGNEKIGILTLLYHMERAFADFKNAGLNVEPLFAENVLADDDPKEIDAICKYYSTPKGGKQYPVDHIRQLLTEGKSLEELFFP